MINLCKQYESETIGDFLVNITRALNTEVLQTKTRISLSYIHKRLRVTSDELALYRKYKGKCG